jgi:pilus assembly protein Flp/PilA
MSRFRKLLTELRKDTRGLTAVEYAVLGGLVVAAIVAATATLQTDLTAAFGRLFSASAD